MLFRSCTFINKIGYADIRYARVGGETDFAGPAVAVAHLDMVGLYLRSQFTQGIGIEFGMGETAVTSKTTATYLLGNKNLSGTKFG